MRRPVLLALTLGMALHAAAAHAQTAWPAKQIRILVGYAAGGSTDVTARILGQALSERLGQPVIIENRPGAAGNLAADATAKADPDGYTLMMGTSTTLATNPSLYKSLPFDVHTDFAPITLTAFIPNLMVVNPSVPANNVPDFIAYLKANPDRLNFGSAGNGSSQHLAGALFNSLAGARMIHVPYRGGAPAVNDLLGGQVEVIFAPLVEVFAAGARRQGPGARHYHRDEITAPARCSPDRRNPGGLRGQALEWTACAGENPAGDY
jgi:tripartite-type tricarboxylate transporter receptor subunit TctC